MTGQAVAVAIALATACSSPAAAPTAQSGSAAAAAPTAGQATAQTSGATAPTAAQSTSQTSGAAAAPTTAQASGPSSGAGAAPTAPQSTSQTSGAAAQGTGQPAASGAPFKIGVLADISPAFANQGAMMRVMTDYAVQTINAAGGINGRPLQVSYADPKGDPSQAVQLATQFIQQDNVDALVGAVSSAECLGVEDLAAKATTVYVTSTGCATDALTSTMCNTYTFRTGPQGVQTSDPFAAYLVKQYGPNWAIIYQDYAFGQSYSQTMEASLARAGGDLKVKIAMPLSEPNVTPYVSQIPSDGSVTGFLPPTGGSDVSRVMSVFNQFGLQDKMVVAGASVRENFGGVWPDVLNGEVFTQEHPSVAIPGNALSEAWVNGANAVANQPDEKQFADIMGGA
ncbi:MAG: ABC transporter substrate-binding protein, partial [Chloroflexi bacterium]|nr:ABC transporter substrate-binding protein [Chloroflexota bacterium]